MPQYRYRARDRSGHLLTGDIDAPNEEVLHATIREHDWILLQVHEKKPLRLVERLRAMTQTVKQKQIVIFARQLAVLISATVPIVRALRILAQQTESRALREALERVAADVDGGTRLSAALHRMPHIFDDFFVYMIRAGETTGRLDEVLTYLADQKEKDYQLLSRIVSSLIYPAFIVCMLIIIFVFMMVYVVPKLLDVVTQSGAELPLVTRFLVGVSTLLQEWWWVLVLLFVAGVVAVVSSKSSARVRSIVDLVKIRTPILGKIFTNITLTRFSRSFANLLASGVPVTRCLEITADVVGNHYYKRIILTARDKVTTGTTVSKALEHESIPPLVIQMVAIGEETGRLDQILLKVSDFYMSEVDSLTQALISLVEPVIIILLGIGALILVSGILLPIYSITGQLA